MRIAIVTGAEARYSEVMEVSTPNKREYCSRHGYGYFNDDITAFCYTNGRPGTWGKVQLIRNTMRIGEGLPYQYDWIFWSDVDTVIVDLDKKLEDFLDESATVIISRDSNGFNDGNFFLRNDEAGRELIEQWWKQTAFIDAPLWQQDAFEHLYKTDPAFASQVKIVDQREFNAYDPNVYSGSQYGDFLYHYPGLPNHVRARWMQRQLSGRCAPGVAWIEDNFAIEDHLRARMGLPGMGQRINLSIENEYSGAIQCGIHGDDAITPEVIERAVFEVAQAFDRTNDVTIVSTDPHNRSAAIAAAYLVATKQEPSIASALARIDKVYPVAIHPALLSAITNLYDPVSNPQAS